MSEPYLSEIRIMSFGFPPKGWALCNGQLLPINQNQALFSLLGTTYGGDGRVNFGLPNLQGNVPIHMGNGHVLGERGGELIAVHPELHGVRARFEDRDQARLVARRHLESRLHHARGQVPQDDPVSYRGQPAPVRR